MSWYDARIGVLVLQWRVDNPDCTSFVQDGLRGLDHACFLAHEEVAKLLTRYGASVQVASEVNKHKQHIACMLNASCKDTVGPP